MSEFELGAHVEEFRAGVRGFLAEHLTDEVREHEWRTGDGHNWVFHRALAARGWAFPTLPVDEGGPGLDDYCRFVLLQELYLAGAPLVGWNTTQMPATVIRQLGSAAQREILREIASGDAIICLGFTEPDSGSDVAAAKTRAVRDGEGWIVSGQKMFTTLAHLAQYCFLLTRTNTEVAKHRGLTVFLVPLDAPGIEIQPVRTTAGERTNIVFYNDVVIPDAARLGEIDGGWSVMNATLGIEHANASFWGVKQRLFNAALQAARSTTDGSGRTLLDHPINRERLARAAVHNEVALLMGYRSAWQASQSIHSTVDGPITKLFATETFIADASEFMDMLGPGSLPAFRDPGGDDSSLVEFLYRYSFGTTIYGGSSEVMRGIVAEQGLGLPRSR